MCHVPCAMCHVYASFKPRVSELRSNSVQVEQTTQAATCRCVLGDRAYSKAWGGSVLDSVIGTFLTQNVSDQLSSKAYMTLAARFPAKPPIQPPCPPHQHSPPSCFPPPHGSDSRVDNAGSSASSSNVEQGAETHADESRKITDDFTAQGGQLVMTDGADFSDAVDWEAVRVAPLVQVSNLLCPSVWDFAIDMNTALCCHPCHARHL